MHSDTHEAVHAIRAGLAAWPPASTSQRDSYVEWYAAELDSRTEDAAEMARLESWLDLEPRHAAGRLIELVFLCNTAWLHESDDVFVGVVHEGLHQVASAWEQP